MNREFMIGCNYWSSTQGIYMWRNWEEDVVKKDLEELSKYGVTTIRVFPLWCDFQPVEYQRTSVGNFMKLHDKYLDNTPLGKAGIDKVMMERFEKLLDFAYDNNISVIVGLITGFMSGKHFYPPAFLREYPLTSHFAMVWEQKFIRAFVTYFKGHKAIKAWNPGNECNTMTMGDFKREDAVLWTGMVVDAIRSVDNKRPIYSGMHGLKIDKIWNISDQGELCDALTVHPYPMFTSYCDIDPMNSQRGILHAAAEAQYYSGVGEKPCFIEEINTLGPMVCSEENAVHYIRRVLLSGFSYDTLGFLWWCGFEQNELDYSPYCDCALERELGLLYTDYTPKPFAYELKKFSEEIKSLNLLNLSKAKKDAVCILSPGQDHWAAAYAVFTLGTQTGMNIHFCYHTQDIPEADVYFMPCISGLNGIEKSKYNDILNRVENGAKLYISNSGGFLSEFEKVTGLRPLSRRSYPRNVEFEIDNLKVSVSSKVLSEYENISANILVKNDDEIILTENTYGKGKVHFCTLPLEEYLSSVSGGFDKPFYKIYKEFAKIKTYVKEKPSYVGFTRHIKDDKEIYFFTNYSYNNVEELKLFENINYNVVYGNYDGNTMSFNDGLCILEINNK